jgi:hypothetical protein
MSSKTIILKDIMKLGKSNDKAKAEDIYMNLSMKFKNVKEGLFKVQQIMNKYKLPFDSAVACAIDPTQLEMLKTMAKK